MKKTIQDWENKIAGHYPHRLDDTIKEQINSSQARQIVEDLPAEYWPINITRWGSDLTGYRTNPHVCALTKERALGLMDDEQFTSENLENEGEFKYAAKLFSVTHLEEVVGRYVEVVRTKQGNVVNALSIDIPERRPSSESTRKKSWLFSKR